VVLKECFVVFQKNTFISLTGKCNSKRGEVANLVLGVVVRTLGGSRQCIKTSPVVICFGAGNNSFLRLSNDIRHNSTETFLVISKTALLQLLFKFGVAFQCCGNVTPSYS